MFTSPYSTLDKYDKYKSRSSDTINSIPGCPPTPRFPVPEDTSPSLAQLLKDLAHEGDSTSDIFERLRSQSNFSGGLDGIPPQSPQSRSRRAKDSNDNNHAHLAPTSSPSPSATAPSPRITINPFQVRLSSFHHNNHTQALF